MTRSPHLTLSRSLCGTLLPALLALFLSPSVVAAQGRNPTPPGVAKAGPDTPAIALAAPVPASALATALAMGIPAGDISAASIGTSDPDAVGIGSEPLGAYFPTDGGTFAILSTGDAATADAPNDSESTSTVLDGLNNQQGNDLTQLSLTLVAPAGATCLAFDVAFYSEEFPEYVGSQYNDAFTAELGGTDLSIQNDQVVAPLNFAFDVDGNLLSINTVFGVSGDTGTNYDGATPLLRAVAPLEGSVVQLVFSIQDLGDSIYDSAVFLDNFDWLYSGDCAEGLFADSDGDALIDDWEINGIDVDGNGSIDLDLPAMGADPQHKDAFIEIDYMVEAGAGGHTHKPKAAALDLVIDTFANSTLSNPDGTTGVTLHIDAGSDTVMDPVSGDLWGALSESDALAHQTDLGTGNYSWADFDTVKGVGATPGSFSVERRDVFHYAIFAHNLSEVLGSTSGISRGILASDFIVSLGGWTDSVGTVNQQAGTLMHEFGHNLDLLHGGTNSVNDKPNYLSVMNYSFQTRGLRIGGVDGNFDYSIVDLPDLNEASLNEPVGLAGGATIAGYGTRYRCVTSVSAAAAVGDTTLTIGQAALYPASVFPSFGAVINGSEFITWTGKNGNQLTGVIGCVTSPCTADPGLREAHAAGEAVTRDALANDANAAIDWNCDGDATDAAASANINAAGGLTVLTSFDDWTNVRFDGGAVGKLGQIVDLPDLTPADELDKVTDDQKSTPFAVSVAGPFDVAVVVGASRTHLFEVTNLGENADTYDLSATSSAGWADLSTLPAQVALEPGASTTVAIVVTVDAGAANGATDELTLEATSTASAPLMDSDTAITTALVPTLEDLIAIVGSLDLPPGLENSLLVKLNGAPAKRSDGNPKNDRAASNMIGAFIHEVEAQSGKKIPAESAAELVIAAELLQ